VPLSEHEQRALDALEQTLYQQDPEFVHRVRADPTVAGARRRLVLSVLGAVVGLGLLLAFCLTTAVVVGVAGFLVMFASLSTFWTSVRLLSATTSDDTRAGRTDGVSDGAWHRLRRQFRHGR